MGETDIDELIKRFDKDGNSVFDKVDYRSDAGRSKARCVLWGTYGMLSAQYIHSIGSKSRQLSASRKHVFSALFL